MRRSTVKPLRLAAFAVALAPLMPSLADYQFFHFDEGTALHGYASYAEWLASANVGTAVETAGTALATSARTCTTASSSLEARYRTIDETDGIALRSDKCRATIIIIR